MGLSDEVLLEMATDYKERRDPATFEMIIMRVDKLLLRAIHKLLYTHPILKRVPLEDLYHTSIIGLHKALISFQTDKSAKVLIGRIFAYVNMQVFQMYRPAKLYLFLRTEAVSLSEISVDSVLWEDEKARGMDFWLKDIELSLLLDDCKSALAKGIVTSKEWELLVQYYCDGLSSTALAKQEGLSGETIRKRITCTVLKIRNFMENSTKRS